MVNSTSCKYYTERCLGWMLNNKMIVFLSLLSFCLFVSTLAIAGQRNRLSREVNELTEELANATSTTPAPSIQNPDETPVETPDQTPDETPVETPDQTPDETPVETPDQTPDETPVETPDQTPGEPPVETPDQPPVETPDQTPGETPEQTPDQTPDQVPDQVADQAPDQNPQTNTKIDGQQADNKETDNAADEVEIAPVLNSRLLKILGGIA